MFIKKFKYIIPLFALAVIIMVNNSCKKDNSGSIQSLFAKAPWQLTSIMVYNYVGDSELSQDTLNTTCDTTQIFTFGTNTCTYTNFDCLSQPVSNGTWVVTGNQVLQCNMVCRDTTAAGKSSPFANAKIINLGNYSMVLQTGDIQTYYTATTKRRILQYAFVRQKAAVVN